LRREIIPYKPELKEIARQFRNNPTPAEAYLWKYLKGKQLLGFDFHRQKPLGYYIVDFYCCELRLAIEIDGSVHKLEYQKFKDVKRQDDIEDYGIRFIRFSNSDIMNNIDNVLDNIKQCIKSQITR
jgi:very-short-patch-repair endonuclease